MKYRTVLLLSALVLTPPLSAQNAPTHAHASSSSNQVRAGHHQEMMEMDAMKADVQKMKASLAAMKANLASIRDQNELDRWRNNVDLWQTMVDHMEQIQKNMESMQPGSKPE